MITELTKADVEQLQSIKQTHRKRGTPKGQPAPSEQGRRNADHRCPRLPSDLACYDCGGAIPNGERCQAVIDDGTVWGTNRYGGFSRGQADRVLCMDCADE